MFAKRLKNKAFAAAILFMAITVLLPVVLPQKSNAVTASNWRAGRIIDDTVFYNKYSMSAAQIQQFLNVKVPDCDRNRASSNPSYQPPWTCLKEYQENTATKENNIGRPEYQVPGGKSAAIIIWEVAQEYGINPQVLIVMLQKEQGLITDNWPWKVQYQKAMGYACPDTAPCDTQYYGFYNQISSAAWQLKRYIAYPNNYNFKAGVSRYIQYSPNAACGGSQVYIENPATAALYNYTPYQPNAGALANMYGTADCGAYGNRNFWRYFNDWFGSTTGPFYYFSGAINPPSRITYGEVANAQLRIMNNSSETWYSDTNTPAGKRPFRIMNRSYKDSSFANTADPSWLGTKNQVRMVENQVAPGQVATFNMSFKAPTREISETFDMILVQDGVRVFVDQGLQFRLQSIPDYSYKISSVDCPAYLHPGDMYRINIRLLNTGIKTWYSDANTNTANPRPIRIANTNYQNSPYAQPVVDPSWLGTKNQVRMVENQVAPGQVGTFSAIITAPYTQIDKYRHNYVAVLDGVRAIGNTVINCEVSTPKPDPSYSFVSATNPPRIQTPGTESTVYIKIRNDGNMIWRGFDRKLYDKNGKITLGDLRMLTLNPGYRNSQFANVNDSRWLGTKSQIKMKESIVTPGQIATFEFSMTAPPSKGEYLEYLGFVIDGSMVLKDIGLGYPITVK